MMFHYQKLRMSGGGFFNKMSQAFNGGAKGGMGSNMKGPSMNTEELLKKLDEDDFSDTSTINSVIPPAQKVVTVKKKGRKPKNK
jgi:hypothetical protein